MQKNKQSLEIKFNGDKTKMITFNKDIKRSRWSSINDKWQNKLKLNNEPIGEVDTMKYLRQYNRKQR